MNMEKILIRPYCPEDCAEMARLFYRTVHSVCTADYTAAQLDAWAPPHRDLEAWNRSFLQHRSWVAVRDGIVVGFGDIDDSGYLDRLYVHCDFQRCGIATLLCDRMESAVAAQTLVTHASITARPFFEHRGYTLVKAQTVERFGVCMTNFVMEKHRKLADNRESQAVEANFGE